MSSFILSPVRKVWTYIQSAELKRVFAFAFGALAFVCLISVPQIFAAILFGFISGVLWLKADGFKDV